jgi:hypothetical protein
MMLGEDCAVLAQSSAAVARRPLPRALLAGSGDPDIRSITRMMLNTPTETADAHRLRKF